MRISKAVLQLSLLSIFAIGATASASSTCNMRNGTSRFANTNPEKETTRSAVTASKSVKSSSVGKKGKK